MNELRAPRRACDQLRTCCDRGGSFNFVALLIGSAGVSVPGK